MRYARGLTCAFGAVGIIVLVAHGLPASAQSDAPTNSLPNPYETVEGWAKMPDGRTWGSTSAVDIDRDGKTIWVAERCGANACAGSTLDPVLHFDEHGKLIKSFGAGLMVSPHGIFVDKDDNIWVTDCACTVGGGRGRGGEPAPPAEPKGHQVFKFNPDGKLLMTLGKAGGGKEPEFFFAAERSSSSRRTATSSCRKAHGGDNSRIIKFDKDRQADRSWGRKGSGQDEFDQPHALALRLEGPAVCRRSRQQPHPDLRPERQLSSPNGSSSAGRAASTSTRTTRSTSPIPNRARCRATRTARSRARNGSAASASAAPRTAR